MASEFVDYTIIWWDQIVTFKKGMERDLLLNGIILSI
jgi:hypothetical protein